MSDRDPNEQDAGPGRRRTPYQWELDRQRAQRKRRIAVILAGALIGLLLIGVAADAYLQAIR